MFAQKDDSQSMSTRNKSSDEQEAVLPVDKERKVIQKHATWNCRQCKAVNDEQNKFCISCGARKRLHETELERPGKSIYQEDQLPKTSECSEQDDKPTARTGGSSKHKIIVAALAVVASVALVFWGFQLKNILPIGQHNEAEDQGEAVSAQKQEEIPEQNETPEQDEIILQEQPTVTEEMPTDGNYFIDLIDYIGMDIDEFCDVFGLVTINLGPKHIVLSAYVVPGETEIVGFGINYPKNEKFTIAGITSSAPKSQILSMLKAAGFEEEYHTEKQYRIGYYREEDNMRVHISRTVIADHIDPTVQRVSNKQTEMIALYSPD